MKRKKKERNAKWAEHADPYRAHRGVWRTVTADRIGFDLVITHYIVLG
jgi:hypothetical protein